MKIITYMHISYKMCPLVAQIEKYSDSALIRKIGNPFDNRAVDSRKNENCADDVDAILTRGARCGEFQAQKVSLDLIERIRLINPIR